MVGAVQLEGRPVLTRRSLSLRRQSPTATQEKSPSSYFNLSLPYTSKSTISSSCSEEKSPPPPYFSPQLQAEDWVSLLQQTTDLPYSLLLPTSAPRGEKRRPISFHGTQLKDPSVVDVRMMDSNLLVQRQLASMREELLRMRRRCAELSEVEARKKGLELRCLGLERIVEELMSAVELLKVQSQPTLEPSTGKSATIQAAIDEHKVERIIDEPMGLCIEIDGSPALEARSPRRVSVKEPESTEMSVRDTFMALVVASRRRFIPYQFRAMIRFLILQFRSHDLIDGILGVGIIIFGAVIWTSFLVLQKGQQIMKSKPEKVV